MRRYSHRTLVLGLALALFGASVGIAGASIPQSGVYTGCYNKNTGALRVIDSAVAGQKCASNERQITWGQTGPAGADGADGADGTNAMSKSFWSGPDFVIVPFGLAGGAIGQVAATGPIPAGWWAVTGDLRIEVGGAVRVWCSLVSSAPGQTRGGLGLVELYTGDFDVSGVTVPIRLLVDATAADGDSIGNIQCLVSPAVFPGTLELRADLLIIPSEQGQVGVAP